jgi:lysophospholipase L1-like esterase
VIRGLPAALALAAVLIALTASPASAGERYVALGDSFSSGAGTGDYALDPGCERSRHAYPARVAARRPRLRLVFAACAGATTADVLATQASRLSRATRWITITIGGNDIGFAGVIGTCAQPGASAACASAIDRTRDAIRDELPAKLDAVYDAIRTRAPAATVIVLGYPRLFTGDPCASTPFSATALSAINATADLLRDTIRARATSAGRRVRFRDAIPAFAGHEVCSGHPWLHGVIDPLSDSYHPNRAGQDRGYARLVLRAMRELRARR